MAMALLATGSLIQDTQDGQNTAEGTRAAELYLSCCLQMRELPHPGRQYELYFIGPVWS